MHGKYIDQIPLFDILKLLWSHLLWSRYRDWPLLIHSNFKRTFPSQHRASRPEARHQTQTWETAIHFQPSQLRPYFPNV